GYYGLNWDSLIDCLSDLKWIASNKICVLFDGQFLTSKSRLSEELDSGFRETLEIIVNRWNRTDLTHEKRVLIGLPKPI
ncbi:MAG: barstar family protein, partial [Bdellovibrio sp.]